MVRGAMVKGMGRLALAAMLSVFLNGCSSNESGGTSVHVHEGPGGETGGPVLASPLPAAQCINDMAGDFPCRYVDMLGGLHFNAPASDIWGWHDEQRGVDYALLGLSVGTAFIRLSSPSAPEFIAFLPTATRDSDWRDIKVVGHHAVIVSEAENHGMQVVDLHTLRDITEYTIIQERVHYHRFGAAHNVAVNDATSTVYVVGSNDCLGGLGMIDMALPEEPRFLGCYSGDRYTHDAQCVLYEGPDTRYLGRELCFAANEDTLTIVDVSDKSSPQLIAREPYVGATYSHQGWLTEDQGFFLLGDEGDETEYGHNTRTYIWDLADLRNPKQDFEFTADTAATDHNLYIMGDHVYQANYQAGVRILRHGNLAEGELVEVGHFDTMPSVDTAVMTGAWSVFPFFSEGLLVTANTDGRFFVLRSRVEELSRCDDGLPGTVDAECEFGK